MASMCCIRKVYGGFSVRLLAAFKRVADLATVVEAPSRFWHGSNGS